MNYKLLTILMLSAAALAGCGGDKHDEHGHEESSHGAEDGHGDHAEGKEGDGHREHVKLTPAQMKTAKVGIEQAGPAIIRDTLTVYGVIAPNAERVRDVGARFPGVIRTVDRKVGDTVKQGETLATVESNESLQTYSVVAPLSGVVIARQANPGEQTGEKVLFTVADLSTVWVQLSLFPRDITKIGVGQSARVKSPDTGLSAEGQIVYVAPFSTGTNQTLTARVQIANPQRQWAPGLYVTADITLAEVKVPVAVRNEALQMLEAEYVVFMEDEEGFAPRTVRTGRSDGEWTEILDGVKADERYAADNSFILKAQLGKGEAEHAH